jgi:hypothetical protein
MGKIYTSYEEIDKDLEILALERQISYHKLVQNFDSVKDSISPGHLLGKLPKMALGAISSMPGSVKSAGLAFLVKKLFKL